MTASPIPPNLQKLMIEEAVTVRVEEAAKEGLIHSDDKNLPGIIGDAQRRGHHDLVFDGNGNIVDRTIGDSLDSWWKRQLNPSDPDKRPVHWIPQAITDLGRAAFYDAGNGLPSLKAKGEYVQQHGVDAFLAEAERWGCKANPYSLRPGTVPTTGKDMTTGPKPVGEAAKNPWYDDSERGQERRISIIKSLGARKAAEFAKAAGKTIDGRPLRETIASRQRVG